MTPLTAIREHGTHGQVTHVTDGVVTEPVHQKPYVRPPSPQWQAWDDAGLLTEPLLMYLCPPDWDGFATAVTDTALYRKLLLHAPPNLFTALGLQITSVHSIARLLELFALCAAHMPAGEQFTVAELTALNELLARSHFVDRVPIPE